eukprot:COSAG01_NODE_7397_length_3224_cov_1.757120_3_plen_366_part_01
MSDKKSTTELKELYYGDDVLGDRQLFFEQAKKLGYSRKDADAFLTRQRSSQLRKQFKRPKQFSSIIAPEPGTNYQADLMFIERERGKVSAKKFSQPLLNVVDVHSRRAWSIPIKSKKKTAVLDAFKQVMADKPKNAKVKLRHLNTDDGKEFVNKAFKDYLAANNIKQWVSDKEDFAKNAIVERFNRTLRLLIDKFKADFPSRLVIDNIGRMVAAYNRRRHSTIKAKPIDVWNGASKNSQKYRYIQYDYKVGDSVRVLYKKKLFEKGTYGWRPGIYTIYKIKGNYPRAHYVKDSDGKKLKQHYMGYQLQKVEGDEVSPDYDAAAVAKAQLASKARSKASKTIRKLNKEGIDPEAKVKKKKLRKRKLA